MDTKVILRVFRNFHSIEFFSVDFVVLRICYDCNLSLFARAGFVMTQQFFTSKLQRLFLIFVIFRELPLWERIYCWVLIVIGLLGGAAATYISVVNIVSADFQQPCYIGGGNITVSASH